MSRTAQVRRVSPARAIQALVCKNPCKQAYRGPATEPGPNPWVMLHWVRLLVPTCDVTRLRILLPTGVDPLSRRVARARHAKT